MSDYAVRLPVTGARAAWRFASRPGWARRIGVAGVALLALVAAFAPLIAPYKPDQQDLTTGLHGPTWHHLFGTDTLGQDIFSRVIYAARIDLQIGVVGVTIPFVIGTIIGLAAGYYGGWLDAVTGRLVDIFTAFPFLVLVIAIVAMLGPGLRNLYIAIAVVSWVAYARIVRGETLSAKRREYVVAAHGLEM